MSTTIWGPGRYLLEVTRDAYPFHCAHCGGRGASELTIKHDDTCQRRTTQAPPETAGNTKGTDDG